eukprot:COSAG01_NODE_5091_length_4492_cov_3.461311_2_plen_82_part_00
MRARRANRWHEARAIICDAILHTDMATHPATVSMLAEKERFDPAATADRKQARQLQLHACWPPPAPSWRSDPCVHIGISTD